MSVYYSTIFNVLCLRTRFIPKEKTIGFLSAFYLAIILAYVSKIYICYSEYVYSLKISGIRICTGSDDQGIHVFPN